MGTHKKAKVAEHYGAGIVTTVGEKVQTNCEEMPLSAACVKALVSKLVNQSVIRNSTK